MTARGSYVKDKGFAAAIARITASAKMAVTIGVHGDAGEEDGTPLAVIASANEYGTEDGHIPERSFIRSTVDEEMPNLKTIRNRVLVKVVAGQLTPRQAISLIGAYLQGKIQEKIASGVPPPNAPATIAAKGSSTTLIDTGRMRQAITYEVHEDGFDRSGES